MFSRAAYLEENFLPLQYGLDLAIIDAVLSASDPSSRGGTNMSFDSSPWEMLMRRSPYPPFLLDNFVAVIQQELPLLIMLSFVFYAMQIVKDLVHEKENKLKASQGWLTSCQLFICFYRK